MWVREVRRRRRVSVRCGCPVLAALVYRERSSETQGCRRVRGCITAALEYREIQIQGIGMWRCREKWVLCGEKWSNIDV